MANSTFQKVLSFLPPPALIPTSFTEVGIFHGQNNYQGGPYLEQTNQLQVTEVQVQAFILLFMRSYGIVLQI